jgi:hypothetical protein
VGGFLAFSTTLQPCAIQIKALRDVIHNLLLAPNTPTTTVQSSTSRLRVLPGGVPFSCATVMRLDAEALSNAAFIMALAGGTLPKATACDATRAAASLDISSHMPSVAKMTTAGEAACSCRLLVLGLAVMYLRYVKNCCGIHHALQVLSNARRRERARSNTCRHPFAATPLPAAFQMEVPESSSGLQTSFDVAGGGVLANLNGARHEWRVKARETRRKMFGKRESRERTTTSSSPG